mgnify:CR=1 FL=1
MHWNGDLPCYSQSTRTTPIDPDCSQRSIQQNVRVKYESVESGVKVVRNSDNLDAITHLSNRSKGETVQTVVELVDLFDVSVSRSDTTD